MVTIMCVKATECFLQGSQYYKLVRHLLLPRLITPTIAHRGRFMNVAFTVLS